VGRPTAVLPHSETAIPSSRSDECLSGELIYLSNCPWLHVSWAVDHEKGKKGGSLAVVGTDALIFVTASERPRAQGGTCRPGFCGGSTP